MEGIICMHKTTTALLTAAATTALCLGAASPASAADTSVRLEVTSRGDSITTSYVNTRDRPIRCQLIVTNDPFDPTHEYVEGEGFGGAVTDIPANETRSETFDGLTVGDDYFVEWACQQLPSDGEFFSSMGWGTPALQQERFEVTAQPTRIVVGDPIVPETPACTGSVCLPTGSFGF